MPYQNKAHNLFSIVRTKFPACKMTKTFKDVDHNTKPGDFVIKVVYLFRYTEKSCIYQAFSVRINVSSIPPDDGALSPVEK